MVVAEEQVAGAVEERIFKPKKGSVFPAKRRSVKRMMFDSIIESIFRVTKQSSRRQIVPLHDFKKNDGAGRRSK
ncbi:hypothetical protein F511_05023 [Dorcoceras hygrometricum]|uniref:Uncharacterized protein n=1 Tax=Dorcoceras hygrometricum TaxID=472368 RepID=A0A2Z7AN22_9LAMI|nr:hypothetical protein F511_05023 [Dorcoceras hygrometricum]